MTDTTSKTYIVAEVWPQVATDMPSARFVHPNPRTLPEALAKVRELVEANRPLRDSAASTIEVYELRGIYPVQPPAVIAAANPGLPPTEDVLDQSKPVKFPNV